MHALSRLEVRGYRSLRDVDVPLEPGLNVLIGPNGAGKSNLLGALRLAHAIDQRSLQRFVAMAGGPEALLHRARLGPPTPSIHLRLTFAQAAGESWYEARLIPAGPRLIFEHERYGFSPLFSIFSLGELHEESKLFEEARDPKAGTARAVRHCLGQTRFLHVHDTGPRSTLRAPARGDDDALRVHPDGSNLALVLWQLLHSERLQDAAAWQTLSDALRAVAPFIKELAPTPVSWTPQGQPLTIALKWRSDQDETFGVEALSDGTLRAIALFTALCLPDDRRPDLLCIDEPELGLHPAALAVLVSLMRAPHREKQLLVSTQSTELVSLLEPRDILVAEQREGATHIERLSAGALQGWLDRYSLGALFTMGLLGGRP